MLAVDELSLAASGCPTGSWPSQSAETASQSGHTVIDQTGGC
jgi:hypothetical protein